MTNVYTIQTPVTIAHAAIAGLSQFFAGTTDQVDVLTIVAEKGAGIAERDELAQTALASLNSASGEIRIAAHVLNIISTASAAGEKITRGDIMATLSEALPGFASDNSNTISGGIALAVAFSDAGEAEEPKLFRQVFGFKNLTGQAAADRRKLGQVSAWGLEEVTPTQLRKIMGTIKKEAKLAKAAEQDAANAVSKDSAAQSDAGKEARTGKGGPTPADADAAMSKAAKPIKEALATLRNDTVEQGLKLEAAERGMVAALVAMGVDHKDI